MKERDVETKPKGAGVNVLSMLKNGASKKQTSNEATAGVDFVKESRSAPAETKPKESKGVNVLSMLQNAASTRKSANYEFLPTVNSAMPMESAPSSFDMFDADVLAQLPDEIRREILSYPDEYLRIAETEKPMEQGEQNKQRKEKRNSATRSRSRSSVSSRSRSETPPPPPPPHAMRMVSTHVVSPLNESDLKPSTSKAALVKHKQRQKRNDCRADQIVVDYMQELPQHMHPAILQYLTENETIPSHEVPPSAEHETKKEPKTTTTTSTTTAANNVFVDPKYKSMLAIWVKSEEVPKPADVDLMYMNICCLVEDNKMDEVYEVMKYLCRLIKAKRASCCRWHMAYNEIESNIQEKVHEVLDCHIYFTEAIDCYKCA